MLCALNALRTYHANRIKYAAIGYEHATKGERQYGDGMHHASVMSGSQKFQIRIRSCSEILGSGSVLAQNFAAKDQKKILVEIKLKAFTAPAHVNTVKVLYKDPQMTRLLKKTRIRIHSDSGQKSSKSFSCSGYLTGVCPSLTCIRSSCMTDFVSSNS